MKRRRSSLSFLPRLAIFLVLVGPTLVLALRAGGAFLNYADKMLKQATPIIAYEASRYMQRTITIGELTPNLSVDKIWTMFQHLDTLGTLPVVATDISIGNQPAEIKLAGRPILATARRVTAYVSVPTLLGADRLAAVKRIVIEAADAVVYRDPRGQLSVLNLLPKRPPPVKPSPPFRTVVEVVNSRVHFRDYASFYNRPKPPLPGTGPPQVNDLDLAHAITDLSGTRTIRFDADGHATPGSETFRRLGGPVRVAGTFRRGTPGVYTEAPGPDSPRLVTRLQATDADAPYWYYYLLAPMDAFRVTRGRVDATVGLDWPSMRADAAPGVPALSITLNGRFRDAAAKSNLLPVPLTDGSGTLSFVDGALQFDGGGRVLGTTARASGALWNLTPPANSPPGTKPTPEFVINADVPRLPVIRAVRTFLPKNVRLPDGLMLGGNASVAGTVSGRVGGVENLVATGHISGIDVGMRGYPAASGLSGDVTFSGGRLDLTNLRGTLEGGGTVAGQGALRVRGAKNEVGNAVFSATASNVNFATIRVLDALSKNEKQAFRLSGRGDVAAVGWRTDGKLTAAANVTTHGLKLGAIDFPVARGRVIINDNKIVIPSARVESPVGIANIGGDVDPKGALKLRFAVHALDLQPVGTAFGQDGLRGLVSGLGTISGTVKQPRVVIDQLSGMNLRVQVPTPEGQTFRRLSADTLTAGGIIWEGDRVELTQEVVVRRYPASIHVSGSVAGLTPPSGGGKLRPRLNLSATVRDLEYDEVMNQITPMTAKELEARIQRIRTNATAPRQPVEPDQTPPPNFSGAVQTATVKVVGPIDDIHVSGEGDLGNLVIGKYPLKGGHVALTYDKTQTRISDFQLYGTVGSVTGTASLMPSGYVYGKYQATELDLRQLAFLTSSRVRLDGKVALSGTLGGTLKQPEITAKAESVPMEPGGLPTLKVGNITLTNAVLSNLRYTYLGGGRRGELRLPELSFKQGNSTFRLTDARWDVDTGEVAVNGDVEIADVGAFLQTLRQSGISFQEPEKADAATKAADQTAAADDVVITKPSADPLDAALSKVPEPVSGSLAINDIVVRGRIVDGQLQNPQISAKIDGKKLQVGGFTTDTLTAQAALNGRVVTVKDFEAIRPGATIRGHGTYDPDGNVSGVLESNELDLDSLRSIPGLEALPLRGAMDVSIGVEGSSKTPNITASLGGRNLWLVTRPAATAPVPGTGESSTSASSGAATSNDLTALAAVTPAAGIQAAIASSKVAANIALEVTAGRGTSRVERGVLLNLVRISASIDQDTQGRYQIEVPEIFVRRGDAVLRADAKLPFAFDPADPTLADRPININLELPRLDLNEFTGMLAPITPAPQAPDTGTQVDAQRQVVKTDRSNDLGGTVEGNIHVGGTLHQPTLAGKIALTDVKAHLRRDPLNGKDRINPIRNFTAALELSESRIHFKTFELTLGDLNRDRDAGKVVVTGDILLQNLSDLQNLLRRPQRGPQQGPTLNLGVQYQLDVAFNGLNPQAENFLNQNEVLRSRVDGELTITGKDLLHPVVTSVNGPILLTKTEVRLPSGSSEQNEDKNPITFNPKFDLNFRIVDKVSLSNVIARFDAVGDVAVRGNLFERGPPARKAVDRIAGTEGARSSRNASSTSGSTTDNDNTPTRVLGLRVLGDLETRGGYVLFPTVRFDVQRGGGIEVRFGGANPGIVLKDVQAKGRISSREAISAGGIGVGSSSLSSSGGATTYKITVTLNGPLIGVLVPDMPGQIMGNEQPNGFKMTFESDPYLTERDIAGLIFAGPQIALARQGNVEDALRSFATQALTSGVLTGALSGYTEGLANTLALETLTLDYNADASFGLRLVKRLPDPFERFEIEYARSFRTKIDPTISQQPFTYRISYEIFDFSARKNRPRIQLGISQNEQRVTTTFLEGRIRFGPGPAPPKEVPSKVPVKEGSR